MKEDLLNSQEYQLWVLLAQTRNIVNNARNKLVNRRNIPVSQGAALYYIHTDSKGVTIGELARYLFRSHNSVSELVTRMEKKGWLKRVKETSPNHRVRIVLTEEGKEACHQACSPEFIHEIISSLTPEQREQLQSLLGIVRERALKTLKTRVPLPHPHD